MERYYYERLQGVNVNHTKGFAVYDRRTDELIAKTEHASQAELIVDALNTQEKLRKR